jgi:DNA topoisomerase-1
MPPDSCARRRPRTLSERRGARFASPGQGGALVHVGHVPCSPAPLMPELRSLAHGARDLLRDSQSAARAARLRYVQPGEPGLTRRGSRRRFRYLDAAGHRVRSRHTLERIAKLAIPPAWRDVWICASDDGHLQATGIDARGRKQYRYHPTWRSLRDGAKYRDILPFVQALPRLRRRLDADLRQRELTKNKVLATVLRIIMHTPMRVGNEKYAVANGSYGVTTLRSRHARVHGGRVDLAFRGKGGKPWRTSVRDQRVASAVKRCRDLPGELLFQYVDEHGVGRPITSSDVNEYIRESTGEPFTAKEFRTWAATLGATIALFGCQPCSSVRAAKATLNRATEVVAAELGNTVAVCRRSYVDPAVFDCFLRGELHARFRRSLAAARQKPVRGLSREEQAVSLLLRSLQTAGSRGSARWRRTAPPRALAAARTPVRRGGSWPFPAHAGKSARAASSLRPRARLARAGRSPSLLARRAPSPWRSGVPARLARHRIR